MEQGIARSEHILVMDDDQDTRELFGEVLEEEGYRVTLTASPNLDRAAVADLAPDLILLDLRFGDEPRGVHVLEQLKASPETLAIPVLVCSADHDLLQRLHDHLVSWDCGVLAKPFGLDELLAAIRRCVGQIPVARIGDDLQMPAGF